MKAITLLAKKNIHDSITVIIVGYENIFGDFHSGC